MPDVENSKYFYRGRSQNIENLKISDFDPMRTRPDGVLLAPAAPRLVTRAITRRPDGVS